MGSRMGMGSDEVGWLRSCVRYTMGMFHELFMHEAASLPLTGSMSISLQRE